MAFAAVTHSFDRSRDPVAIIITASLSHLLMVMTHLAAAIHTLTHSSQGEKEAFMALV